MPAPAALSPQLPQRAGQESWRTGTAETEEPASAAAPEAQDRRKKARQSRIWTAGVWGPEAPPATLHRKRGVRAATLLC